MPRNTPTTASPIVHLVGPGAVKINNGQLEFRAQGAGPVRLHLPTLKSLHCYGPIGFSDQALQALLRAGIDVAWVTQSGRVCRGRLTYPDSPHAALRAAQAVAVADPVRALAAARWLIGNKILAFQDAVRHLQRHGQAGTVTPAEFRPFLQQAAHADRTDRLLGIEGQATQRWYDAFRAAIRPPFDFPGRVRRPPTDPVNALLRNQVRTADPTAQRTLQKPGPPSGPYI